MSPTTRLFGSSVFANPKNPPSKDAENCALLNGGPLILRGSDIKLWVEKVKLEMSYVVPGK